MKSGLGNNDPIAAKRRAAEAAERAEAAQTARSNWEELSLDKRVQSFGYALDGVRWMLRTQPNAWIHSFATVIVVIFGCALQLTALEWAAVMLCIAMVWFTEAMNTAFEHLCDVVQPEFHPLVKRCKDIAAGAVLIAAFCASLTGLLIFLPKLAPLVF